jgi:hypothetical protein
LKLNKYLTLLLKLLLLLLLLQETNVFIDDINNNNNNNKIQHEILINNQIDRLFDIKQNDQQFYLNNSENVKITDNNFYLQLPLQNDSFRRYVYVISIIKVTLNTSLYRPPLLSSFPFVLAVF